MAVSSERDWLWGSLLVLAVMLVYLPVWQAGFVWDDDNHVTLNPSMIGLHGLQEIWTTKAARFFPLTLTTYWMEHALWGLAPLGYHLVNVIQHAACAVVLWLVLRNLRVPGAWLGAALWALHPVEVESVAWVAETKNTQSALFFLLAIFFFVRGARARESAEGGRATWDDVLTVFCAALAMASKTSTVVLPVVLGLGVWWMEGRWHWRNLARLAPIFLLTLFACVLTIWAVKVEGTNGPQWGRSWPERLATAGDALWFYLGKLFWPHPLISIYPRWQIDAASWQAFLPLLAAIVAMTVLWWNRQTWARPWFFAFAYYVIALLPVVGLLNQNFFRYSFVADHFQYLASMGPLALAGAGMVRFANFLAAGNRWLPSAFGATVLAILGIVSWQRAWVYQSEETLWTDVAAKDPNGWVACDYLGMALISEGKLDEAARQYQKGLKINPNYDRAHNNYGNLLVEQGQLDEAMTQFQQALKINPNYIEAYDNLGIALLQKGLVAEAIAQYQKALAIAPDSASTYNNLGNALNQKGETDQATAQYEKALEIDPTFPEAHNNLGNALNQKGEIDQAIVQYREALAVNPDYPEARDNLGIALLQKGQVDEAIGEFQKTIAMAPENSDAHYNLGYALIQKGRIDEAIVQFQEVVRLNPGDPEAEKNLAKARALAPSR